MGGSSRPAPQPYGTKDYGGFRNILPPAQNGFDNLAQLAVFEATGQRPAHNYDQLGMYANLVYAVQDGWWGYVSKDLRRILAMPEKGAYSRAYCGGGSRAKCRAALLASLKQAIDTPASTIYKDDTCSKAGKQGNQPCFDTISFRALGAITQPLTEWVNRPTFQQVVEVQGHR